MIKIITEDKYAGGLYRIIENLLRRVDASIISDIELINKNGIKNVLKYLRIEDLNKDKYILFIDLVYDNDSVMETYDNILELVGDRSNVLIIEMLCFEELMLNFRYLIKWIRNKEKNCEFSEAIWLINKFITLNYVGEYWFICEELLNFVKRRYNHCNCYIKDGILRYRKNKNGNEGIISTENVAYLLLNYITNLSLFKYEKGEYSYCWFNNCCNRNKGDFNYNEVIRKCNLEDKQMTSEEKLYELYFGTEIHNYFDKISEFLGIESLKIFDSKEIQEFFDIKIYN